MLKVINGLDKTFRVNVVNNLRSLLLVELAGINYFHLMSIVFRRQVNSVSIYHVFQYTYIELTKISR